ncbi:MAG: bL17 family ribosomal protein, partial [Bacteroidales bacterium]|nr:bL17 family ribosomal protein [Bacteroidales bacterium]
GYRVGDNAEMAIIELVDYSLNPGTKGKETKAKSTRRGGKKATVAKTEETVAEAPAAEETKAE